MFCSNRGPACAASPLKTEHLNGLIWTGGSSERRGLSVHRGSCLAESSFIILVMHIGMGFSQQETI